MKVQNFLKALLIIIALSFSTNSNASTIPLTGGGWFSSFFGSGGNYRGGGSPHVHKNGCHGTKPNKPHHHKNGCHGTKPNKPHHHKNGCHGTKPGTKPGKNPSVPLDGGLSFLLLGAAAFGVKKLRGNKNETV